MDERFRKAQRAYEQDAANAPEYIRLLEQRAGVRPWDRVTSKANNNASTFPCLLCEKQVMCMEPGEGGVEFPQGWFSSRMVDYPEGPRPIMSISNANDAITVTSRGNWGSRTVDGE